MKYNRADIISLPFIVSVGRRQEVAADTWEVYAILESGIAAVMVYNATDRQSSRYLTKTIAGLEEAGCLLVRSLDDTYVNIEHIERVYVDGEGNDNVALAQDTIGKTHRLYVGRKAECLGIAKHLAMSIATLMRGA